MSQAGQPLHFLGWVLGGWVAARAAALLLPLLWQDMPAETLVAEDAAPAAERRRSARAVPQVAWVRTERIPRRRDRLVQGADHVAKSRTESWPGEARKEATMTQQVEQFSPKDPLLGPPPEAAPAPPSATSALSRWSGTAWLLWRPEGLGGLAQGPLLGGSQAGARIDYRLLGGADRSLNVYGRASRAVQRPFAEEVALGLALRPVRGLPLSFLAERRIALGRGGRNGVALFAAGGIGPRPLAPRLALEGYAQAGMVGFPGADGFIDGKLSLDYRLGRPAAHPDLALGASLSGSAQPGASRLDLGPQLRLRLPVAGGHLRLSAEWRERIAGDARPDRGPVLTLVADF